MFGSSPSITRLTPGSGPRKTLLEFIDFSSENRVTVRSVALAKASAWLEENPGVTVLSIETLHHIEGGDGDDVEMTESGIRVWYRP